MMRTRETWEYPERAPVILVRTGDDEMAVFSQGAQHGWLPLPSDLLGGVGKLFGADSPGVQGRYFTMPEDQLGLWDAMKHHGDPNGYAYAIGWREDGKIGKVFSVKEIQGASAGTPALDPLALANAMAIAQLQASIDELTALVESVAADVRAILVFLRTEQQASILAAVETIDDIYSVVRADGHVTSTDWERIQGLEQVLKQQHRQILSEWQDVASALAFRDIKNAKVALKLDPERVQNLVRLEYYLLRAFHRWTELMLDWKAQSGHTSATSVATARDTTARYVRDAIEALGSIRAADTQNIKWRNPFEMLAKDGIVLGRRHDQGTERDAKAHRMKIQALAKTELTRALPRPGGQLHLVAA